MRRTPRAWLSGANSTQCGRGRRVEGPLATGGDGLPLRQRHQDTHGNCRLRPSTNERGTFCDIPLTPIEHHFHIRQKRSSSLTPFALRSKKGTRVNTACGKKGERGKRKQCLFIYRGHFALVASFFLHFMLKQVA